MNGILASVSEEEMYVQIGIMVETPAAVMMIRELIQKIDFISIGTNDLVQYTLVVDRNNENVMSFYQPFHPVIIRMISSVVEVANQFNKPVSLCGEIASDPRWTPLLLGLGLRSLSMTPLMIPVIKRKIQDLNFEQCRKMANMALKTDYLKEVERIVKRFSESEDDVEK